MKNGYKIFWTTNALQELNQTIEYLEENFSEKELKRLAQKIETTLQLISLNPDLFPKSKTNNIHRVPILKLNTMFYWKQNDTIEILSFFCNRKNPSKRKK